MGQSQRGVEEGGFESGGVGSFKKLTAPSCTEPALQQRIRHGRRCEGRQEDRLTAESYSNHLQLNPGPHRSKDHFEQY